MNMRNNVQVRRSSKGVPYRSFNAEKSVSCEQSSAFTAENAPSLAVVYTVNQRWRFINDGCEGFDRGTIFDELNKPFYGDKYCKNGGCCK